MCNCQIIVTLPLYFLIVSDSYFVCGYFVASSGNETFDVIIEQITSVKILHSNSWHLFSEVENTSASVNIFQLCKSAGAIQESAVTLKACFISCKSYVWA